MLENISRQELINLATQAERNKDEQTERLLREELTRRLANTSLISGVYDASTDRHHTTDHPEDDKWIIRGIN